MNKPPVANITGGLFSFNHACICYHRSLQASNYADRTVALLSVCTSQHLILGEHQ